MRSLLPGVPRRGTKACFPFIHRFTGTWSAGVSPAELEKWIHHFSQFQGAPGRIPLASIAWMYKWRITDCNSPGAGSESKRWPLQRFIELARRLTLQNNIRLLLVMGCGRRLQISKALMGMGAIVAESVALNLLAAILERCRAFVGNDSGFRIWPPD